MFPWLPFSKDSERDWFPVDCDSDRDDKAQMARVKNYNKKPYSNPDSLSNKLFLYWIFPIENSLLSDQINSLQGLFTQIGSNNNSLYFSVSVDHFRITSRWWDFTLLWCLLCYEECLLCVCFCCNKRERGGWVTNLTRGSKKEWRRVGPIFTDARLKCNSFREMMRRWRERRISS